MADIYPVLPLANKGYKQRAEVATLSTKYLLDYRADFTATVGNNSTSWNGAIRGVVSGANLTKTRTSQAPIHGVFWVTGTNASTRPKCAVLGEIHDGVATADACFVAMTAGSSTPRAMFGVAALNPDINTAEWGLDLSYNCAQDIKVGVGYTRGDIRMSNDVIVAQGGAPVDGTAGTQATAAGPGSLYIDTTNKKLYINTNTKASPTWTLVGGQT